MPKIKSPETFVPNQVLTAAAQQNHVDGSYPLPGFITEHPSYATANTVASDDKLLISDTSDTAILKKVNASEILNSGLAITTNSISGVSGSDIVINPAANQKVDVNSALEANSVSCLGNNAVSGNQTVGGTLDVTGTSTFTGTATFNGTANFTGNVQLGGVNLGSFIEVIEENIPNATGVNANTLHSLFTSASYTKPTGQVWIVEVDLSIFSANNGSTHYRLTDSADTTDYCIGYLYAGNAGEVIDVYKKAYLNSANTHSGTFVFRVKCIQPNITVSPTSAQLSGGTTYPDSNKGSIGKFRIYKYKV